MPVDLNPSYSDSISRESPGFCEERYPLNCRSEVACFIIATNLKVATVFSKAEGKNLLLDNVSIKHGVENRSHIDIVITFSHPEDSVCLLRIEQIGLILDASESVLELIKACVVVVPKMQLILHKKA